MASGGSLRRFVGEVVLDAPTLEELLRAPLELLALNHFASELREVVVSGHAHLRWLELLGTHVALRAEDCPALVQTSVTHARQVELRRLPSLRLAHLTGNVVLDDLPVLECIGAWGEIDSLTLVGTPALRRVVLRAGYGAAVAHVARAAGAHVVTDPGKVAKVTPSAPKRTVSPKLRSHPRLGWDGVARAVLVVGKPAAVPLAEKVVSALGTVAAWWANERGEHISAVAAFDSTTAYLDAGVHDLVLGRVVACVTDGAAAAITRTDLEHEREAVADELADLWVDANGIVKKCAFDGEVGVYLVACGPDSRAALSAEGRELEWSDERGVPYVRVDLDRLPEVVSLTGASSGLHPRHACR
jgi:hypothetical protein